MTTVGIAIPSIPPRGAQLQRAVASVTAQTFPVAEIAVALDIYKQGAGDTRNRAKAMLRTQWVGFLDDDDELYPDHVAKLLAHALATGADLVFPWYDVVGNSDPLAELEHIEWNDASPHMFPITVLMRTELAMSIDFPVEAEFPGCAGEDWRYWNTLLAQGAHFAHLYDRTWRWHHDGTNTSGLPSRW